MGKRFGFLNSFLNKVRQVFGQERDVHTGDGTYVEGSVSVKNGNFAGRDNISQDGGLNIAAQTIGSITFIDKNPSITDIQSLREAYLNSLFETCDLLSLAGIDPRAASDRQADLELSAVYTALLTRPTSEEPERAGKVDRQEAVRRATNPFSALEMLNRYDRLVLLGDPGSGKSTFVSFVVLCMAGELLNNPKVNLNLLRQPLPEEAQRAARKKEEAELQPWGHKALLPVRIVLRDLAARGMLNPEDTAGAGTLLRFLDNELEALGLHDFAPHLQKELREQGGLVMFDGLDEVPEAEKRRAQIKQIVEKFAAAFPHCRILVTSRPYAYQKQEWRLANFSEATLAPFSTAQIEQFIDRWYAQITAKRGVNLDDARGKAVQLKAAALGRENLRGLAERPLLLTLMASLHAWRGGSLPEKREQLYNDAVDLLLDGWETLRVVRNQKGEIVLAPTSRSLVEFLQIKDRQQVRGLLNRLAFEAHERQPKGSETGAADVPEGDLAEGLMDLSEREDVDPVELRNYLSQRAGILLPKGAGVYTFPHRTFQEYLTACYLTDNNYPYQVAELACLDYERWREVTLLAGAKAARGTASSIWWLVDALCYEEADKNPCGEQGQLWGAHLAGQALVESADLTQVNKPNVPKLERVRHWLVKILEQSQLTPSERVLAGDNLARLGDPRFIPELFHLPCEKLAGFAVIPAGPFFIGSNQGEDPLAQPDEQPQREVKLETFYLACYPTTTAQFNDFVKSSGYQPANAECLRGIANAPVVWVTWQDALAYCEWLDAALRESQRTPSALRALLEDGFHVSLPMELEWEKAARGKNREIYPWGSQPDADRANIRQTGIGRTTTVGCFPRGVSPYEIMDMGGNVWEWTRGFSARHPDVLKEGLEDLRSQGNRILKGGSWSLSHAEARCASHITQDLKYLSSDIGFRICLTQIS